MTLVEMMVVIAIIAIVIASSVSFHAYLLNARLDSAYEKLHSSLQFARNEAQSRNTPVTICVRNWFGSNCSFWSNYRLGWFVFTDGGTKGWISNGDKVLWETKPLDSSLRIYSNSFSDYNRIEFDASGNNTSSGNITVCDSRTGETGKKITVNTAGEIYSEDYSCS